MSDFHWKNLVRCAVRNVRRFNNHHISQSPYWFAVSEMLGVGSTSAIELCNMFGVDPHEKMPALDEDDDGRIPGIPEGRDGIWLICADTAVKLLEAVDGDVVHNLLTSNGKIYFGVNWDKDQAIAHVLRPDIRLAMIFSPRCRSRHHLVALNDEHRWSFDVGEIAESRMVQVGETA